MRSLLLLTTACVLAGAAVIYEDPTQVTSFKVNEPLNLKIVRDHLKFHHVQGELPANTFSKLPKFTYLQIKGNITYIEPGAFHGLHHLIQLDLHDNGIRYLINGTFRGATNLRFLNLGSNDIRYIEPHAFHNVRELENLNLNYNYNLKVLRDNAFFGLTHLKVLSLIDCGLREIQRSAFYSLEQLESLDLSRNNFKEISGDYFVDLIKLNDLNLSHNKLTWLDPRTFQGKLLALRKLNIMHNDMRCDVAHEIERQMAATVKVAVRTEAGYGCII
ncbi:leucine-rich repeat-containing protein 15-like isoform X2 [Aethina tumida]|nr:leucine-rich repeat-containing protein 15-like isoform X2 [Aethina tumida]XP_049822831.1 leucine-rich repeat-containing protein 15-like isoform X2 [Aethina tumida]